MSTRRILLVEDNDGSREGLRDLLQDEGYEVTAVSTGREARESFRTARPDLVVLDLGLPDCNGLHLLAELQSGEGAPPVIVASASAYVLGDDSGLESLAEQASATGAAGYLDKPFHFDDLVALLDGLLGRE